MIIDEGLALIREFEGCRLRAYLDTLAKPPVWTVGYGETGPDITEHTIWTHDYAERRLRLRVREREDVVHLACTVQPNEYQRAALVSLAYNIGSAAFRRSSVLRLHNSGRHAEAAAAFAMWNKAGGKVRAGLTRRRAAEAALYLRPTKPTDVQTTRAMPDFKDPHTRLPGTAIAAVAGGALTALQQVVAQVSDVWDGLARAGLSPHVVLALLGTLALGALLWFVVDAYRRNREGDV